MRMIVLSRKSARAGQSPTGRSISIKGSLTIQLEGDKIVSDQATCSSGIFSRRGAITMGLRAHKQGNRALGYSSVRCRAELGD